MKLILIFDKIFNKSSLFQISKKLDDEQKSAVFVAGICKETTEQYIKEIENVYNSSSLTLDEIVGERFGAGSQVILLNEGRVDNFEVIDNLQTVGECLRVA